MVLQIQDKVVLTHANLSIKVNILDNSFSNEFTWYVR